MKKTLIICFLSLFLVSSNGCGSVVPPNPAAKSASSYSITDSRGKSIHFDNKPQRIVCGHVFADEILLDLVEPDRITGLSKWVHDPGLSSSVEKAQKVAGVVDLNMESIIRLSPDLVILADNAGADFVSSLESAGLKVYVFRGIFRINEIAPLVSDLARLVGEQERGQAMVMKMNSKLEALAIKYRKHPDEIREAALIILRFGAIGGTGSIYNDSLVAIGLKDSYDTVRTIKKTDTSMILSKEEIVKANPDLMILGSWTMGGKYKSSEEQLAEYYNDPALATVSAIKNHRVVIVPQRLVNCLSHHVGEALEQLALAVHKKQQ